MDCIFCKIVAGEIPAQKVYEDENVLAFNDIHPKAPTHILIIPKKHIASVAELSEEDRGVMGELILSAKKIAAKSGLSSFRLITNTGIDAGQEVFHLHFHLLGGEKLGDIV